ncbi:MAG TPA: alkaline phosphatase family protein [Terriglobales bacterium]|nr:alkaline phosphatase family protein [Terriglobales bacterium]
MAKGLNPLLSSVLLVLAPGLTVAQTLPGSGHTTLPVGNYSNGSILPTGQVITPTSAPGSTIQILSTGLRADGDADAAEAVNTALSPDGKTLLVLTSGWNRGNRLPDGTSVKFPTLDPKTGAAVGTTTLSEWVFVYAINSDGTISKLQQINIPSTYSGLAWAPAGARFYVSGGQDDRVYVYKSSGALFVPDTPFILLGHNTNQNAPFPNYDGSILKGTKAAQAVTFGGSSLIVGGAVVSGLALSRDGKTLVAANFENDSISVVDTATRAVTREIKFFTPGATVAQGEFPYDVVVLSNDDGSAKTAFVTSQRDDQVMIVDIASGNFTSMPVGDQPNRMVLSKDQRTLYVVNGNSDSVSVISASSNAVLETISLSRPGDKFKGANANSAALSADERTLYVTLGFENAVAVVDLHSRRVLGRIPTGWYPTSVSVSRAQGTTAVEAGNEREIDNEEGGAKTAERLYVCTFKSNTRPNPANGPAPNPTFLQTRSWPLAKAQMNIIPVPDHQALEELSRQVDENNGIINRRTDPMMTFLLNKIEHVIYIVKENKTYDQVLGDLPRGNGDPTLTQYPQAVSPNHHSLAMTFGLLDNFYDSGQVSGDGWGWSTYAETTDYNEKTIAVNYGNGGNGVTYDTEGTSRLIGTALPESDPSPSQFTVRLTTLLDPSGSSAILPGAKNVSYPSGADDLDADAVGGHLWDSALRANKTVRNYGFFVDQAYYITSQKDPTKPDPVLKTYLPISPTPFASHMPQGVPLAPALRDKTDIYFRGFDMNNADTYLYNEWARDMVANGLPALTLLRLPHDHFGSTGTAIAGLKTPSLQMSDNDYAIGKVIDTISHSPYWHSTAIFILEDDSQSGGDHVDSHRSLVYAISPYSKRGVTISTNYNTVNVLRTIEDLLGIAHLNQSDANAAAMADVFTRTPDFTAYSAIIPGNLCAAPVDPNLVPACKTSNVRITPKLPELHDAAWWAENLKGFDFHDADRIDAEAFNRVLWKGIMGNMPYPTVRSGLDLRNHRTELLKQWEAAKKKQSEQLNGSNPGL